MRERSADAAMALELELHASLRGASIRRAFARAAKPAAMKHSHTSATSAPNRAPARARSHAERGAAPSGVVVLAAAIVLQLAVFASSSLAKPRGPVALGGSDAHVASLLDRCDNLRLLR